MTWGTCAGCAAKDDQIVYLRGLVESLRKENLNLVDARAAKATFPREAAPAPTEEEEEAPEMVHASPAQVRDHLFRPDMTPEKFEELFDLQEKVEREGAS